MAFFDDLGKKLSQAGQTAVQKTREMTEISRLNGAIAEQERKLSDTYIEIGKLYVLMHEEDYDSKFSVMINLLKESEQKIKDFRQQIQNIKGVAHCEKCGAEIGNNVAFCSFCGTRQPQYLYDGTAPLVKCEKCGAMVDATAKFCVSCGQPIPEKKNVEDIDALTYNLSNNKNVCANCNAENSANSVFCTQCGTKI